MHFHRRLPSTAEADNPTTCTEAEPFALRVLDDSMQPEFRRGCIIVIDPTGHARHGSFVLAHDRASHGGASADEQGLLFRQLIRCGDSGWLLSALNDAYPSTQTASDLADIVGVIVQRAGIRRRYHKRYD